MYILINDHRLPEISWLSAAFLSILCPDSGIIPTIESVFRYHVLAVFPVESIVTFHVTSIDMTCVSKLHYVIGVTIIMHHSLLNFWNGLQIILLKCILEKTTFLLCVSTRDWKRKKEQHVYTANQYSVYLMSEKFFDAFSKREPLSLETLLKLPSHLRDRRLNFNWLNHQFNLPWHLHRYDRNHRTAGRVQLNECGSIHTFGGVQR